MSDSHRSLREIVTELHEALEAPENLPEDVRSDLRAAGLEIQEALDESTDTELQPASLRESLNGALERFEGNHPKLTEIVGRIADALSEMGI